MSTRRFESDGHLSLSRRILLFNATRIRSSCRQWTINTFRPHGAAARPSVRPPDYLLLLNSLVQSFNSFLSAFSANEMWNERTAFLINKTLQQQAKRNLLVKSCCKLKTSPIIYAVSLCKAISSQL